MAKPRFEDNVGLVTMQAKMGMAMAGKAGVNTLDYDDMFQEASIAFMVAADAFDESLGLKFSAYYTKACFSQFRRAIGVMSGVKNLNPTQREEIAARKEENKRRSAAGQRQLPEIDYKVRAIPFSAFTSAGEDEDYNIMDRLPSECPTPEQMLSHKQALENARAKLSPLAQLMVDWLQNPPQELIDELNRQNAHADLCAEQRVRAVGLRHGLTIDNMGKFINMISDCVTDTDIVRVKAELNALTTELEAV